MRAPDDTQRAALRTFKATMRRLQRRASRAGIDAAVTWLRTARLDHTEADGIGFEHRARGCRESDGGLRAFLYERAAAAVVKLRRVVPLVRTKGGR